MISKTQQPVKGGICPRRDKMPDASAKALGKGKSNDLLNNLSDNSGGSSKAAQPHKKWTRSRKKSVNNLNAMPAMERSDNTLGEKCFFVEDESSQAKRQASNALLNSEICQVNAPARNMSMGSSKRQENVVYDKANVSVTGSMPTTIAETKVLPSSDTNPTEMPAMKYRNAVLGTKDLSTKNEVPQSSRRDHGIHSGMGVALGSYITKEYGSHQRERKTVSFTTVTSKESQPNILYDNTSASSSVEVKPDNVNTTCRAVQSVPAALLPDVKVLEGVHSSETQYVGQSAKSHRNSCQNTSNSQCKPHGVVLIEPRAGMELLEVDSLLSAGITMKNEHKFHTIDLDTLRKCIALYPILLEGDSELLDKFKDPSVSSAKFLEDNQKVKHHVQVLCHSSELIRSLWFGNTPREGTYNRKSNTKVNSASVNSTEYSKVIPPKRAYKDPKTCPGPCFNCHGSHHEYLCPWACRRCNSSQHSTNNCLHIPRACTKRNWINIMGPFVNEEPCFEEFTPASNNYYRDETQPTTVSNISSNSKPSNPKRKNRRARKRKGKSKDEYSNRNSAMLSHANDTNDSKDSNVFVQATEFKVSHPRKKGLSAEEVIAANNSKRSMKKVPVLKGLQALSTRYDCERNKGQVLGEQHTDSKEMCKFDSNLVERVQDIAITDLTTSQCEVSNIQITVDGDDDDDSSLDEVIFVSATEISAQDTINTEVVNVREGTEDTLYIESTSAIATATSLQQSDESNKDIEQVLDDDDAEEDYYYDDLTLMLEDSISCKYYKRGFKKIHNPKRQMAAIRKASKLTNFIARQGRQRDKLERNYSTH